MIITITLIITSLVALNFLLLAFSCNKTTKKEIDKIQPAQKSMPLITTQLEAHQLAATGS